MKNKINLILMLVGIASATLLDAASKKRNRSDSFGSPDSTGSYMGSRSGSNLSGLEDLLSQPEDTAVKPAIKLSDIFAHIERLNQIQVVPQVAPVVSPKTLRSGATSVEASPIRFPETIAVAAATRDKIAQDLAIASPAKSTGSVSDELASIFDTGLSVNPQAQAFKKIAFE